MRNIKLLIQYEGTAYAGWQRQDNALGIQEVIEEAIKKVTGEEVRLIGSGRTDRKVHALGQVANFHTSSQIPGHKFKYALNIKLPEDIQIIKSKEVDKNFHSRYDAKGKRYKYIIYNSPLANPIYRNFSYHIDKELDIYSMEKTARHFIGSHDFKSFMGPRTGTVNTIRTISKIDMRKENELIYITIEGNSFLRHMIRIIVGTLVYVGIGKFEEQDIPKIIEARDRTKAGPTAPPQGLFLEKVYY